jgi:hypothetical protein
MTKQSRHHTRRVFENAERLIIEWFLIRIQILGSILMRLDAWVRFYNNLP